MSGPATEERPTARGEPEFAFWDFVGCAVCHLPFSPPDRGPPPLPFWVTDCGHVLCNSHLDPNQSCARCGERGIQLVPLQRNIDPPMSEWFRSLPHAIDGIANAVKFQQDSLAALVRHYRNQCLQLSSTCDRLRNERRSLRRDVDVLRKELDSYRSGELAADQTREPSIHWNHNGKRPMVEARCQYSSAKTNSSPRSVPTPVGPLRLTLPPGEHPNFTRHEPSGSAETVGRPGTSRFAEQYAYHGEDVPRAGPSQLVDERSTSLRPRPLDTNRATMAPPPQPNQVKRFKPASGQAYSHSDQRMERTLQDLGPERIAKFSEGMGPPPTPQRPFSAALRVPSRATMQNGMLQSSSTLQTNRFIPGTSHGRASGPTSAAAMATTDNVGKASSGNRMPFIPQSSSGFG